MDYEALHEPLVPILRCVLASADLPRSGRALDLACGGGLKTALLAEACGPGARLVGLDRDAGMIAAARARLDAGWVVGDALALPLRDASFSAAFCIAALGLFADAPAALRELRRALAPGGVALALTATQLWAPAVRWSADLAARMGRIYAQALRAGRAPLAAPADLGGALADTLRDAGFADPHVRAFLLEPPANPLEAELPLLSWGDLRPLMAAQLAPAELERCDRLAADAEIELCTVALAARARARFT